MLASRSCFGTVLERWFAEELQGVKQVRCRRGSRAVHNDGAEDVRCCAQWMAFDACPLVACLPYSAARLAAVTPQAKLIFMVHF